ncbi:NUDIX hydrolase [Xylanimonas allomyrinae]|uniref:NUDIX hydrolase n=1 Tax=Xylanimonas allomyrinae TaxID=2509459 RepID=UPI001FEB1184|nr:NUDIX domain-containing protein [Xylanimonas allomyrinae]
MRPRTPGRAPDVSTAWTDDGSADHRFRVVPAAYVFLRRRVGDGPGEVLLQLREGTGFMDGHWAAGAAGHVEAGESVVAAAVREAREELGIAIDPRDLRPVTAMHRGQPGGPALEQRIDVFFEAYRWTGDPRRAEAAKAADLRWFAADGLPEPVVPHELRVLRALAAGDVPRLMVEGF